MVSIIKNDNNEFDNMEPTDESTIDLKSWNDSKRRLEYDPRRVKEEIERKRKEEETKKLQRQKEMKARLKKRQVMPRNSPRDGSRNATASSNKQQQKANRRGSADGASSSSCEDANKSQVQTEQGKQQETREDELLAALKKIDASSESPKNNVVVGRRMPLTKGVDQVSQRFTKYREHKKSKEQRLKDRLNQYREGKQQQKRKPNNIAKEKEHRAAAITIQAAIRGFLAHLRYRMILVNMEYEEEQQQDGYTFKPPTNNNSEEFSSMQEGLLSSRNNFDSIKEELEMLEQSSQYSESSTTAAEDFSRESGASNSSLRLEFEPSEKERYHRWKQQQERAKKNDPEDPLQLNNGNTTPEPTDDASTEEEQPAKEKKIRVKRDKLKKEKKSKKKSKKLSTHRKKEKRAPRAPSHTPIVVEDASDSENEEPSSRCCLHPSPEESWMEPMADAVLCFNDIRQSKNTTTEPEMDETGYPVSGEYSEPLSSVQSEQAPQATEEHVVRSNSDKADDRSKIKEKSKKSKKDKKEKKDKKDKGKKKNKKTSRKVLNGAKKRRHWRRVSSSFAPTPIIVEDASDSENEDDAMLHSTSLYPSPSESWMEPIEEE